MSNAPKQNENRIEFIDPEELIGFIQEDGADLEQRLEEMESHTPFSEEFEKYQILKKQENTRSRLALIYTFFTFSIFLAAFIVAIVDGLNRNVSIIDNLKEIIPLISGIFLGTLGFVVGYYFRKDQDD